MQARGCLDSDECCKFRLPCAEIHWDAPISLCFAMFLERRARLWKVTDSLFCCNREQERGIAMYFTNICMPRSSCHQSRISMHDGRGAELHNSIWDECVWMLQQNLTPSWIIRSVGDLGIDIHSVTRSTKRASFPVPGVTPILNTMQYAWYAWNAANTQS